MHGSIVFRVVEIEAAKDDSLLPIESPKLASFKAYASFAPSPTNPTQ